MSALFPWNEGRADDLLPLTLNPQPVQSKRVFWEFIPPTAPLPGRSRWLAVGEVVITYTNEYPEEHVAGTRLRCHRYGLRRQPAHCGKHNRQQ